MICEKNKCTGCGACVSACRIKCIQMKEDEYGVLYPRVDKKKCIQCGICMEVCHVLHHVGNYIFPHKAYAGWSRDQKNHANAASGGIATEIYRYALMNGIYVMGTFFDRKQGVGYREITCEKDIEWARNSKYVFSNMEECFQNYAKILEGGG